MQFASNAPQAAMQFDHAARACTLVHSVDVLRHDRQIRVKRFELSQPEVARMRRAFKHFAASSLVKVLNGSRVLVERSLTRVVLPPVLRPDPTMSSISWNTAFG